MLPYNRSLERPILVTGAPRSGTTWVGKMLSLDSVYYIPELFAPQNISGLLPAGLPYTFFYIAETCSQAWHQSIIDAFNLRYPLRARMSKASSVKSHGRELRLAAGTAARRFQVKRALNKDPYALMAAPWIFERLNAEVLVMIRHPAAFVASVLRIGSGWYRFDDLKNQPRLIDERLQLFRDEILNSPTDVIEQNILLWRIIHGLIIQYQHEFPGWRYIRHEDLSSQPTDVFRQLYEQFGLEWSERIETTISEHSASRNPKSAKAAHAHDLRLDSRANIDSWRKRLTEKQIVRIYEGTHDIAHHFYSDADW